MDKRKIPLWIIFSFAVTIASIVTTGVFNHFGTPVGHQSQEEIAAWEQFIKDFPEKEIYSKEEFEKRGREISRIQNKFDEARSAQVLDSLNGHLFLKETVYRSLTINWFFWFLVGWAFYLSPRNLIAIAFLPLVFSLLGIFYYFELAIFGAAFFVGICAQRYWPRKVEAE